MGTPNADQVVVGANGSVWVAAVGSTAPTDSDTALAAEWTELGYISEEGATFSEGKDVTDILAWQSFYPVRRVVTGRSISVSFALREWSTETIEFALGGTVAGTGGEYTYTPPAPDVLSESALVLQWADGTKDYRLYFPRGIVTETVETSIVRTSAADLPVTFGPIDPGGAVEIYTLFTNDPAFVPGS